MADQHAAPDTGQGAPRGRWHPPKKYPEQLIVMASIEMATFVRDRAAAREESISDVMRDLIQDGIDVAVATEQADREWKATDEGSQVCQPLAVNVPAAPAGAVRPTRIQR